MSWNKIDAGKLHMERFDGAFAVISVDGGTVYSGLDSDVVILQRGSSPGSEMTSSLGQHPSGGVDIEFLAILQQALIDAQPEEEQGGEETGGNDDEGAGKEGGNDGPKRKGESA